MGDSRIPYALEARTLDLGDDQELITGHRLEGAGTSYPQEIKDLYTGVPDGAIGPDARELLDTILAEAGTTNPYRLAVFMQNYLQTSDAFEYDTDITELPLRRGRGGVLRPREARVLPPLRLDDGDPPARRDRLADPDPPRPGLPARQADGEHRDGREPQRPRVGRGLLPDLWLDPVRPDGGGVGQPTVIADGPTLPPATALPSVGGTEFPDPTRGRDLPAGDTPPPGGGGPADRALLVVFAVLLTVVVVTIAIAAWVRGPRGQMSPDTAWQSMAKAATRFGFGPKPTQTVYEYATALGELVPVAKADLQTVAEAKVETTYAGLLVGGARLDAVRDATRRLRVSLLRLLFRRPRKGRRGKVTLR